MRTAPLGIRDNLFKRFSKGLACSCLTPSSESISPIVRTSRAFSGIKCVSTAANSRRHNRDIERDVLLSVLEAAATRRDAKNYLQKYTAKHAVASPVPSIPKDRKLNAHRSLHGSSTNIAIVKLKVLEELDDDVINGLAKTLNQLRLLGLLSVVVLDCGPGADVDTCLEQGRRLCTVIDGFGKPGSKLVDRAFIQNNEKDKAQVGFLASDFIVEDSAVLQRALQRSFIPVVPPLASQSALHTAKPSDADQLILALIRYFRGLCVGVSSDDIEGETKVHVSGTQVASVERLIVLDPAGGIPLPDHPDLPHRFINIEQEFQTLDTHLKALEELDHLNHMNNSTAATHLRNLRLVKGALTMLPSTSSALITSPSIAADDFQAIGSGRDIGVKSSEIGFHGMVTTRRKQNPLLYSLLTDKPVFSSSLPIQRLQGTSTSPNKREATTGGMATLVKRGMPLTIYPDPRVTAWTPPKLGEAQPRLTDRSIDLPRLIHLIEDSFARKIEMKHYLDRLHNSFAGIVIAGDYEGCAIMTWERPPGLSEEECHRDNRFVPYLDKFAVLRSRQGSSGVADMVFNAMVRDCFKDGLCWRSRASNPVNKWYFERSMGTRVLDNSGWKMFWTTKDVYPSSDTYNDYSAICLNIEPSWADPNGALE